MYRCRCRRCGIVDYARNVFSRQAAQALGVIALLAINSFSTSVARAERIGVELDGAVPGGAASLFGIAVAADAIVAGTFSFDTTAVGVDVGSSGRVFHQSILGGLNLSIGDNLHLSASKFYVTISDDVNNGAYDSFAVSFTRVNPATDPPIWVNGASWPSIAFIHLEFRTDPNTFVDKSLTADKPLAAFENGFATIAYVSSDGIPKSMSVTSVSGINSPPGDFNHNGVVDAPDYGEWQKAFGGSGPDFSYADGNGDGKVCLADYTVWRDSLGASGISNGQSLANSIPEPSSFVGITLFLIVFNRRLRKRS
jgi:hypothetical protein